MSGLPFPIRSKSSDLVRKAYQEELREREARRIAQILHDEADQLLSAAHIKLDLLAMELPAHHQSLQEIKAVLDQISVELRRLAHELRPSILDNLGLLPAIEFLADGVGRRAGLFITVEGSTQGRLPPAVETALYRTVQEALTNTSKHARAKRVRIQLWRDSEIHCAISDNGVGADVAEILTPGNKCSLGLIGIQERIEGLGGQVSINSEMGLGLEIQVSIPLAERAVAAGSAATG